MSEDVVQAINTMVMTRRQHGSIDRVVDVMKDVHAQPRRDFEKMLVVPAAEQFHALMGPLYESLQPIYDAYYSVLMAIWMPVIRALFELAKAAIPLINSLLQLYGTEVASTPSRPSIPDNAPTPPSWHASEWDWSQFGGGGFPG